MGYVERGSATVAKNSEKLQIIQSILLAGGMVLVCAALIVYGVILRKHGYAESENTSDMVLACRCISEGVFPWNIDDNNRTPISTPVSPADIAAPANTGNVNSGVISDIGSADSNYTTNNMIERIQTTDMSCGGGNNVIIEKNSANVQYAGDLSYGSFSSSDESYFDDALFIGDSRTVGICDYCGLDNAEYYAKEGMTIYDMMDCELTTTDEVDSVLEGLQNNQFAKIYLMVGINEVGTADSGYFIEHYVEIINQIRELQPDAEIYVQSILHVAHSYEEESEYINNDAINERNEALREMCVEYGYTYLDANCLYDDENGALTEDMTFDGCHLYAQHYLDWKEFYLNHINNQ